MVAALPYNSLPLSFSVLPALSTAFNTVSVVSVNLPLQNAPQTEFDGTAAPCIKIVRILDPEHGLALRRLSAKERGDLSEIRASTEILTSFRWQRTLHLHRSRLGVLWHQSSPRINSLRSAQTRLRLNPRRRRPFVRSHSFSPCSSC